VLELSFPLRVDYYAIMAGSGGEGQWRGGCGAERAWTVLDHTSRATVCFERTRSAPFGICGGEAGAAAKIKLRLPDGRERALVSKGAFDAPAGSQVVIEAPGGGGFGDKAVREAAARERDAADGYVD
jgi:N-methylhydantoinase B/oxoprolinase/acetone carboxylase alpha subunit